MTSSIKPIIKTLLLLCTLLTFWTCSNTPVEKKKNKEKEILISNTNYQAHVAFAGGGYRAHSGHAGWTIALLNNGNRNLGNAFGNVKTISSNSGGSWFSSMLMYSQPFINQIESADAKTTWAQVGWLGLQERLYNAAPCHLLSGDEFTACVAEWYASDFKTKIGVLHWHDVVHKLVYNQYPISQRLGDPLTGWATNKSLLLAGSLLTSQVMLNKNDASDNHFYQACLPPNSVIVNGGSSSSCSNITTELIPMVSPVTFSRIPSGFNLKTPAFMPVLKANTQSPYFNVGYISDDWFGKHPEKSTQIDNRISVDQVLVIDAAAASSAALGFAASKNVTGSLDESFAAEDLALSFQLTPTVQYKRTKGMSIDDLVNNKMVRIADGGPVDNSGVAQLVSYLQKNIPANGINIVAFDNVQSVYKDPTGTNSVGVDIANLFGCGTCKNSYGNDIICSKIHCGGNCIVTDSLQIFEKAGMDAKPVPTWYASGKNSNQYVVYTKYHFKTKANKNYDIAPGTEGTLHAFTCMWEDAHTTPQNDSKHGSVDKTTDQDFDTYDEMIQFINSSLNKDNGKGLKMLEAAFGIK